MGDSIFKRIKELLSNRFMVLSAFFVLVGVLFVFQLADLQLFQGKYYDEQAKSRILSTRVMKAPRGNILDRNGVPIAVTKKAFSVLLLNTGLPAKQLNSTLLNVYSIIRKNQDDINRSLATYISINMYPKSGTKPEKITYKFERMMEFSTDNAKLAVRANVQMGLNFNSSEKVTAETIFNKLLLKYKIDSTYNLSETFNIMCMRFETMRFTATVPAVLATDISRKSVAELEERQHQLSGISTDTVPVRSYIDANYIAHVLGYYREGDSTGIEQKMDASLKGVDGQLKIDVNENGQLVETVGSTPAIPGKNVILTIDMALQKTAVKSLKKIIDDIKYNKNGKIHTNNFHDIDSGAVVAMNPRNGEVLAMASYPSYNPNAFIARKGDKKAQKQISKWLTDPKFPMLNRAIGASYAPGSTYKLAVATAGLESGAIAPFSSDIYDPRTVVFDNVKRYCLERGHGWLDLQRAIETSCNVYFYLLGVRTGIDNIDKWAKAYGLGESTGIDLAGELNGERSNKEVKEKYYGNTEGPWGSLNTALSSIGQYLNRFTPIQMTRYAGALATNGTLVTPHVIQKVMDANGNADSTQTKRNTTSKVPAKKTTFDTIREGMKRVVVNGTASQAFKMYKYQSIYPAAGKTGTAQTSPQHSDNADFMCYAPADNPEIVVFVYLNKGVWGSWAAEVGKDILNKYFDLKADKGNPLKLVEEGAKVTK